MPEQHPIRSWIEILRPELEEELGEMPPFTIEEKSTPALKGPPWGVFVDNKEIILVYDPENIEYFFVNPPPGEEPMPNAIGRLIWDLIHDLCHVYQAESLYFTNDLRFFMHTGYDLSLDGLADFATMKICNSLWRASLNEEDDLDPPLSHEIITDTLENRTYRDNLESHLMWKLIFAFRTAVITQNQHDKDLVFETLLKTMPKGLQPRARIELLLMDKDEKMNRSPKENFRVYDLGIYLGSLLEKELGWSLDKMINDPEPDKNLQDLVMVQK